MGRLGIPEWWTALKRLQALLPGWISSKSEAIGAVLQRIRTGIRVCGLYRDTDGFAGPDGLVSNPLKSGWLVDFSPDDRYIVDDRRVLRCCHSRGDGSV